MFNTPVLLIVFNRPEQTRRVLDRIASIQPSRLFIAADGPRPGNNNDAERCSRVQELVKRSINWECDCRFLFRAENLGCKLGVSTAVDWFFGQVELGIILEDDCLPEPSFFEFCRTLLYRYKANPRVMMICGASFQPRPLTGYSYYFSLYAHCWGWATWADAWRNYDGELENLDENTMVALLKKRFRTRRERAKWLADYRVLKAGQDHIWDTQWMFNIWQCNGLTVIPWRNLVSNIGYGADATHTTMTGSPEADLPTFEIGKISHPPKTVSDSAADRYLRYAKFITPNARRIQGSLLQFFNLIRK